VQLLRIFFRASPLHPPFNPAIMSSRTSATDATTTAVVHRRRITKAKVIRLEGGNTGASSVIRRCPIPVSLGYGRGQKTPAPVVTTFAEALAYRKQSIPIPHIVVTDPNGTITRVDTDPKVRPQCPFCSQAAQRKAIRGRLLRYLDSTRSQPTATGSQIWRWIGSILQRQASSVDNPTRWEH